MLAVVERILGEKCVDAPYIAGKPMGLRQALGCSSSASGSALLPALQSFHDASHSNAILTQLSLELLAKKGSAGSPRRTCGCSRGGIPSDIGMIVTEEQLRTWWSSADFGLVEAFRGLRP